MHNFNDAFDSISEGFGVYSVLIKAFISILDVSMWFWTRVLPFGKRPQWNFLM